MGKNNTSYSQYNVSSGSYNYCVTAVYNNKESAPVCKVVQVTNPFIDNNSQVVQHLEARNVNDAKDIELNWQSPFVSDWMTHAGELSGWIYYSGFNQFTATVRFTVEELQKFYGSKLSKIRFAIRETKCKYAIQVWLTDKNGTPNVPIVNQQVNNPTSGIVEITLNSPVSIAANKELWIGINYELNPMIHVAAIDEGPIVPNRNYVYIDNKWYYVAEEDDFNWFISGYLQFDNHLYNAPESSWLRSTTATAANYVIYCDNKKIATPSQPHYVDSQPVSGSHIYCVSIAYDNGKESESVCIEAISSNETSLVPVYNPEGEINIYPNPIKKGETLVIHCEPHTFSTLSLYNISGQLIQQEQITGLVAHKNMDFEPGIYILQIKNNSNTYIRKIIIK